MSLNGRVFKIRLQERAGTWAESRKHCKGPACHDWEWWMVFPMLGNFTTSCISFGTAGAIPWNRHSREQLSSVRTPSWGIGLFTRECDFPTPWMSTGRPGDHTTPKRFSLGSTSHVFWPLSQQVSILLHFPSLATPSRSNVKHVGSSRLVALPILPRPSWLRDFQAQWCTAFARLKNCRSSKGINHVFATKMNNEHELWWYSTVC